MILIMGGIVMGVDPFERNKILGRGINIGNALEAPNEGDWGVVTKDEFFDIIKEAGFSHVRIPIRWSTHAYAFPPYKIMDRFFKRVDEVINGALKRGLAVVINIHHYEELMNDPEEHKERFLALWKQIADRYKDYPETLFFEILNEPHGNLTPEKWNELLEEALKVIRSIDKNHTIIIGTAEWGGISALEKLSVPEWEKNSIVTIHYYNPFEFTHQGAEWVEGSEKWLGRKWGSPDDQKHLIEEFNFIEEWSKKNKRPIYIGEFGAYRKADLESRIKWTSFVVREMEKRRWSWAYWEFCSGFGVYDTLRKTWNKDLLEALIGGDSIE